MAYVLIIITVVLWLLSYGQRELGPIENIHGIPFPEQDNILLITEPLAHTDIYLKEPVFAKQLILTITYRPVNLKSLAVGIRENSFWLSYSQKQSLPTSYKLQATSLTIPLTDKLQEPDRSIDLMFFAESEGDSLWELYDIKAEVVNAKPTYAQLKNYIRSVVTRERAL